MGMSFSAAEESALQGLVEGGDGDIILRLDRDGLIEAASPNIRMLGFDPGEMLIKPHVADLAEREHQDAVSQFVGRAFWANEPLDQIEFPVASGTAARIGPSGSGETSRWHALRVRPVAGHPSAESTGALGLLRSLEHLRSLENELNLCSTTDPLTGLDNQQSFLAQLERVAVTGPSNVVMLFEIDGFRALQSQFGRSAADEVLWAFARFLEAMMPDQRHLARLQGERFGAVLADCSLERGRSRGAELCQIFAELALPSSARQPKISIIIGVAQCIGGADRSLHHAEMALMLARASGRAEGCVADSRSLAWTSNLGVTGASR